jgi:hypothetical protein
MGGGIDIEADDVAQLVDKLRVGGELELFHSMRLQSMRPPDPLDGTRADIDDLRHQRGGPVGRLCWRVALGERYDALGDAGSQRSDARRPGLVAQETVVSFLHETLLPAPDAGLRFPSPAHDIVGADTIGAQQHDLSPPDMLVWRVAVPREPLQSTAIGRLKIDGNSGSHAPDSHTSGPLGTSPEFKCQTQSTSSRFSYHPR